MIVLLFQSQTQYYEMSNNTNKSIKSW